MFQRGLLITKPFFSIFAKKTFLNFNRQIKPLSFTSLNLSKKFSSNNTQSGDLNTERLFHSRAMVRKPAPQFKGVSWWGNEFKEISLSQFKGKWVVLFFYPLDFTFVCPTEIIQYNDMSNKFSEINAQVIGCSTDSQFSHREWSLKPRDQGGLNPMTIPLLSDKSHVISDNYGVLIPNDDGMGGTALRGTFIIDDKGILRHSTVNDLSAGRNVEETLRLVKAFQFSDKHGEVCPAKWQPGKGGMTPKHGSEKLNDFWKNEHANN